MRASSGSASDKASTALRVCQGFVFLVDPSDQKLILRWEDDGLGRERQGVCVAGVVLGLNRGGLAFPDPARSAAGLVGWRLQ